MKKRVFLSLFGFILLGIDIWLIWRQFYGPSSPFYGLASTLVTAILVPVGLDLIKYSSNYDKDKAFEKLLEVGEIEELINKTSKKRKTVRSLNIEIKNLAAIIERESTKQALSRRKTSLEDEINRIVHELEAIDLELSELSDAPIKSSLAQDEIQKINKIIESKADKDIVISLGKRPIILDRDWFSIIPFGNYFYNWLSLYQEIKGNNVRKIKN